MYNNPRAFMGRGFSFPPAIDKTTGLFIMSSEEEDIKQAIYIILMTRKNEHAMMPDFGCELHNFVFDTADAASIEAAKASILDALIEWEPRIISPEVMVDTSERHNGKIVFDIEYVVRSTNSAHNIVVPYYLNEGI